MIELEGKDGIFAVFSEDEGAGYFFTYHAATETVLAQVQLYSASKKIAVRESDVAIIWSSDQTKCAAIVFGRMRAVLDVAHGTEQCFPVVDSESPAIVNPDLLKGFDHYLDRDTFVRARQRYWKEKLKEHKPHSQSLPESQTPSQTNFILCAVGPRKEFAVFEDDGETGYFYLYSSVEETVLRFVHIYDRTERVQVDTEDVEITWASGIEKCGVAIWGAVRGIIEVKSGDVTRVRIESRDTPGVSDNRWLYGF
jgi:hypothetical protein